VTIPAAMMETGFMANLKLRLLLHFVRF